MLRRIAAVMVAFLCAAIGLAAIGFTNGTVYTDRGLLSTQSRAC